MDDQGWLKDESKQERVCRRQIISVETRFSTRARGHPRLAEEGMSTLPSIFYTALA